MQQNARYVMRITGNDTEGQAQLGNFIDPEAKYPVIVTTSRLLSTGVDAQTCRLIVLDREVGSMTEFKQIVGRGTRVHEDTKKYYFTLIDFRKAHQPLRRPRLRRRAGADLRAGRGRSRSPRRTTCRRPTMTKTRSRRSPATTKIDRRSARRRTSPSRPADRSARKIYVDGVAASDHRRARRVSRRERQAGHREPARLHQEGAQEALRQPRRFPAAAGTPPSASRPSSRSWPTRACCSTRWPRRSARTSTPST